MLKSVGTYYKMVSIPSPPTPRFVIKSESLTFLIGKPFFASSQQRTLVKEGGALFWLSSWEMKTMREKLSASCPVL